MSDDNNFMMIGLHKLAAERGDGLIPELLALYASRETVDATDRSEWPAKQATRKPQEASTTVAGNDNVIPLGPYLLARRRR